MKVYDYLGYDRLRNLDSKRYYQKYNVYIYSEITKEEVEYLGNFDKWLKSFGFDNPFDFYNQPFSFDLITKYFKGWEFSEGDSSYYYPQQKHWIVEFHYSDDYYCIYIENKNYHITIPDTLNRFISNCKQCGIQLELKEIEG